MSASSNNNNNISSSSSSSTTTPALAGGNSTPSLPRRRNGKQQSCEPCRKAKIACDHGLPTCGRCKRRKMSERCVYLAAPMTKAVLGADGRTRSEPSAVSGGPLHETQGRTKSESSAAGWARAGFGDGNVNGLGEGRSSTAQPLTPNTSSTTSPIGELGQVSQASSGKPTSESGPFIKSGGFFGPTNFSAVFLENTGHLGSSSEVEISNDSDQPAPSHSSASLQSQTFLMLASPATRGSPRVALGTKLLMALPDQATCMFLLERFSSKGHECSFPTEAITDIGKMVWKTFGKVLAEPRVPEEVETMSTLLCENAERALEESDDYPQWLASQTGMNMRWETFGLFCGAMCTAVLSLPERDPFFPTQQGDRKVRRNFSVEIKEWTQACITLSNYMDLINYTTLALLMKNMILGTVISGDASLVVWRQLGDLIHVTTALGLHRQQETSRVTFMNQVKRRMFGFAFHMDQSMSLLLGRPPALNIRYCRWHLPLDLSEEVLMTGGAELQQAVAALDSDGWSTEGKILPMTSIRAYGRVAPVLNEILELSLGNPEECTGDRIKHLMRKVDDVYATTPARCQFKMSDMYDPTCPDPIFWRRLIFRLYNFEYRLLLERLAHKQGVADGQSMVDCAREMLELTVLIWVQRDRFVEHHHDYDWMLMCWGIPCSGVLCVELLKQIKHGSRLIIPRSEVVQNLSLLVGFLEWVKPAAGNYRLCMRMRIIIKRILEQILNPNLPAAAMAPAQDSMGSAGNPGQHFEMKHNEVMNYDPNLVDPATWDGDVDNLEWLNNMDWSRGPWFDIGQDFSAVGWN